MSHEFGLPKLHFLMPPEGDPVLLPSDKQFYLGRADGNNMVVDDTRASRRHAEIMRDGTDFILTDLQSSNGTYVNGEQATAVKLKDHDVIEIGIQAYTYRIVSDIAEISGVRKEVAHDTRHCATLEMPAYRGGDNAPDSDFNGSLSSMHIADLFQLLNLSRRTGLLLVQASDGKAMIYFEQGEITQAEYGVKQGDAAVMGVLGEKEGQFSFRNEQRGLEPNVQAKLAHLLLEFARMHDERQS